MRYLCKHEGGRLVGQTHTVYSPQNIYRRCNVMVSVNITYENGGEKCYEEQNKKNTEKNTEVA